MKGRLLEWGQVGVVWVEGRCGKIRGEKVLDPPQTAWGYNPPKAQGLCNAVCLSIHLGVVFMNVFIHVHGMYRPMLIRIIHWSMHFFLHPCTHSVMYVNVLVILIYISLPSVYLSMYPSIHPSIHTLVLRYIRTYLRPCVHTHTFHSSIPFHYIFPEFSPDLVKIIHPALPKMTHTGGHWGCWISSKPASGGTISSLRGGFVWLCGCQVAWENRLP